MASKSHPEPHYMRELPASLNDAIRQREADDEAHERRAKHLHWVAKSKKPAAPVSA